MHAGFDARLQGPRYEGAGSKVRGCRVQGTRLQDTRRAPAAKPDASAKRARDGESMSTEADASVTRVSKVSTTTNMYNICHARAGLG